MKEQIESLFSEARDIFWRRNAQYGTENITAGGVSGVVARMRDKLARIENSKDPDVLRDAGIDFANYGLIMSSLAEGSWGSDRKVLQVVGPLHRPKVQGDVGHDLAITEEITVNPGHIVYAKTGVRILCPSGMWARISGRSSLARKYGLLCVEGVIDEAYTGELLVGMYTIGREPVVIAAGDRVAQVIFYSCLVPASVTVEVLPDTPRGEAGWGSTGRK